MFDSLKFDPQGNRIYPGKTVRTLDWSVTNDTALPSWLSFTNGDAANLTLTVNPMSTFGSDGNVTLQWSGTPSASANSSIKLAFAVDTRQFQEVGILFKDLIVGTSLDATNKLDVTLGIHMYPYCGVWFKQNATSQVLESRVYNQSTGTDNYSNIPYQVVGNGFGNGRKQLGMLLNQNEKKAYLLGGEDVPICMVQPSHPNGANSSWPAPTAAGQMPVMGIEFINKIAANDANAWIKFSGVKAWFVTG